MEGKRDSMGDGYRQSPIQLKETVLTKPIAVFNECMSMKVSVGPEKWLKLVKCLLRRHEDLNSLSNMPIKAREGGSTHL